MYFSIEQSLAEAGLSHALLLVVNGIIVSPSKEEFKNRCADTVTDNLPSDNDKFNRGMRQLITKTTGKNTFLTAGEKLRENFISRGFRSINNVVDAYNEAAFYYGIGIGGHDITSLNENAHIEIRLSEENEKITPLFKTQSKNIKPNEVVYGEGRNIMAWIGTQDMDSEDFRITEKSRKCAFIIMGGPEVAPTELYAVSNRIRRNLIDASYEFDSKTYDSQELYFKTRS